MSSRRRFLLAGTAGAVGAAGAALGLAAPAAADPPGAVGAPAAGVFYDSYAGKRGRLTRSDSGRPYSYTGGLDLVASGGALRLAPGSDSRPLPAAAYQQADLGAPLAFVGAWFLLDDSGGRTTTGSGVLLGAFAAQLTDVTTLTAGLHLVIGTDYWAYYVFENGTPSVLGNGPYAPLAAQQVYYVEVSITGATAVVVTPDGVAHTLTDPQIATLGRSWLTTEVVLSAPTDRQGVYTALQAST